VPIVCRKLQRNSAPNGVEFGQEERLSVGAFNPVPMFRAVNRPSTRVLSRDSEEAVLRPAAPNRQALIEPELIRDLRAISFASPLPVKDQLLIAPVRAPKRH